jgi:DNA helicase-2/ATP-dependent DNA helicase PcrA
MLHGQMRFNLRSRFFDEMPEDSLKWLSPKVQQHQWTAQPKAAWEDAFGTGCNQIAQSLSKKDIGWRIGESVAHAKFGEGVIVNIEGSGGNARAHINFGRHGMKLLDLSVAKLDKLGG